MKTWMAALVVMLGLCALEARAAEPIKTLPAPTEPAAPAAPSARPVLPETLAEAGSAPATCGNACHAPCATCCGGGKILAWLTFIPSKSECCHLVGPRPTPPYAFFRVQPCHEHCGCAAGTPACAAGCSGPIANGH